MGDSSKSLASGEALITRTTAVITETIASLGQATGVVVMAKSFSVHKVLVDNPCRIRLYSTAAARTADLARDAVTPPTAGTQHGVIIDLVLSTDAMGSFPSTWVLAPSALGFNADVPPVTDIYYTIDNLTAAETDIEATITFLKTEY